MPARILAVPDIPRTISGKIVELAVRNVIHGRPVRNTDALANPEALEHFRDRPELAQLRPTGDAQPAATSRAAYRASLQAHGYRPDAAQEQAIARLEELRQRLGARRRGWIGRRWGAHCAAAADARGQDERRGVYLWGGVGRGKTFLMDLFHAHAGVPARREHFHRFMKEVHARLHALRDAAATR